MLNMKYHHSSCYHSNTKHDIPDLYIKYTNLHGDRGKYAEYRYVFVFTVVLGCALYFPVLPAVLQGTEGSASSLSCLLS